MIEKVRALLHRFEGDDYLCSPGVLTAVGEVAKRLGRRAIIIRDIFSEADAFVATIKQCLADAGAPERRPIDEYMGPIMKAAKTGKPSLIKTL